MPGADAFFAEASRGGGPYAGAVEPMFDPFGGGLLSGSPLAGMALQLGMQSLFGGQGVLAGQFLPTQNLYSQIQGRQYQEARLRALQQGFAADKQSYIATLKGLASLTGTPFGLEQARAADTIAGDVAAVMPFLAPMMPELADQLHGPAGSRGLLAESVFRRGLHELDPLSGAVGLSAESAAARSRALYRELYERGTPGSGLAAMRGIGAGTAGSMLAEMQRMGIAGGRPGLDRGLRAEAGALEAIAPGLGREALAGVDARGLGDNLRKMAGAVSAMRDIFGDAGHPDAPMPALMKALNDLTQGGLHTMAPQRVEELVRRASATAKLSGVSVDAMAGLMAQTAGYAERIGLDRSFGAEAATQALAFGAAYGDVGRGDVAAFGRGSKAEYTLLDARRRANAADSPMARTLAAMWRFEHEMGGRLGGRAADVMRAAAAGDVSGVVPLDPGELMEVARRGGMPADTLFRLMEDREGTQAVVQSQHLMDVVRRAQPLESRRVASQAFRGTIQGRLMASGVGQAAAESAAARLSDAMGNALFDADRADTATDEGRRRVLSDAARGAMAPAELRRLGLDDHALRELGVLGFAEFGRQSERTLGMGAQKVLDLDNARTLRQADLRERQAAQDAAMSRAMSALGRAGPMARLVGILQAPPVDEKTGKVDLAAGVARFLGGVPTADLSGALAGATTADQLAGSAASTRVLAMSQGIQAAHSSFQAAKEAGARAAAAGDEAGARSAAEAATEATARVEALAGGSAGEARSALKALLRRSGLKESDVDDVIAGKKGDPTVRDQVRALVAAGRGNLNATASEAGVAVGSKVSREDVRGAYRQLRLAQDASHRAAAATGEGRARELDRARRLYRSGLDRSRDLADAALGSAESVASLGPGGFKEARRARELNLEIEAIARQHGKSAEELLASDASGGPEARARDAIRGKYLLLQAAHDRMDRGASAPDAGRHRLSPDEKKAYEAYRAAETGGQLERTKSELRRLLGGRADEGALTDDRLGDLAKMVGSGAEGDLNLARLKVAGEAAARLDAGGVSGAERQFLERQAGALARVGQGGAREGGDLATVKAAIRDVLKGDGPQDKVAKMELKGSVRLEQPDKLTFVSVTATGTPVVA